MAHNKKHNENDAWQEEQKQLFMQLEVPFKQDKEEIWAMLSKKIEAEDLQVPKTKVFSLLWFKMAAACLVLLICSTAFCKFYTTSILCDKGMHLAHQLPDGSSIQLNAASSVSYAPYWWYFDRSLQLEGEAFFEVKKGSRFAVCSRLGQTEVLGTSFNIFARGDNYRVLCKTGKVKVSTLATKQSVFLTPNELALLNHNRLEKTSHITAKQIISWTEDKFNFNATPLQAVFAEIERQYNVNIVLENIPQEHYRGSFDKKNEVETTLNLICLPFNLKFVKSGENNYKIVAL